MFADSTDSEDKASTAEDLVLRAICQLISGSEDQYRWGTLSPAEWQEVGRLSEAQGVSPLVHWHLAEAGVLGAVPEAVRERLSRAYYQSLAQNSLLFEALERILTALDEAQIDLIVLKGAGLAGLYPDPALRRMGDLDLLVRGNQCTAAVELLRGMGYSVVRADYLGLAGWLDEAANHHVHLRGGVQGKVAVEVHWNLVAGDADQRSPRVEWFWDRRVSYSPPTGSARAFRLEATAHLLYLAAHLWLQHNGRVNHLISLLDAHLLATKQSVELDWETLVSQARELRWCGAVHDTLRAAQACFGTRLPEGILERLAEYAEDSGQLRKVGQASGSRALDTLRSLENYDGRTRRRLLWALLFPSRAFMRWKYGEAMALPVAYLYRWWDIGRDGISTVVKSFDQDG